MSDASKRSADSKAPNKKRNCSAKRGKRSASSETDAEILQRLLNEKVKVTMGGIQKEIPAGEAIVRQLSRAARAGDVKAYALLSEYRKFVPKSKGPKTVVKFVTGKEGSELAESES